MRTTGWCADALRVVLGLTMAAALGCGDDDGDGDAPVDSGVDQGPRDFGPPEPDPEPIPKRPWVVGVNTTMAMVRWETPDEPTTVELTLTPEEGGEARTIEGTSREDTITIEHGLGLAAVELPDFAGTYYLQQVTIDELTPNTCYTYEVTAIEEGGRFCTMHEPTDHTTPIELLVVGDTSPVLGATAGLIDLLVDDSVEMTIHAGDLQYYDALFETWAVWFPAHAPILAQGAFWPTIGNHEEERDGEYDQTYARYFENPSLTEAGEPDGNTSAYHFQSGGVHFFSVNSEDDIGEFDEDFSWLDEGLTAAEASEGHRFSIVFFHRPIWTLAEHSPSESLRAVIDPILDAHEVPLVLQGHNHVYERFSVDGRTYIVTGGGGSGLYTLDDQVEVRPDEAPLRVAAGVFQHGVRITIDETEMHLRAIDNEGTIQDEVTLPF
ncbi:MAG: metallophosphoesterase family protein [Deltaproteobacteria bacterium]|nr:metallophosphoesterase family protein [Deltaproteobacteria bacterium]